jgi:hypothetical protein
MRSKPILEIRIVQLSVLTYQFKLSLVNKKIPREASKVKLLGNAFNSAFNLMEN